MRCPDAQLDPLKEFSKFKNQKFNVNVNCSEGKAEEIPLCNNIDGKSKIIEGDYYSLKE